MKSLAGFRGSAPEQGLGQPPQRPLSAVIVPFLRQRPDSPLSPKAVYGGESANLFFT